MSDSQSSEGSANPESHWDKLPFMTHVRTHTIVFRYGTKQMTAYTGRRPRLPPGRPVVCKISLAHSAGAVLNFLLRFEQWNA